MTVRSVFVRGWGLVAAAFVVAVVSNATLTNVAFAQSGQAFSISPPLLDLSADPGKNVTATIKLTNVSSGPLVISSQVNDFGSKNETGEPNIIFDNKETPYSLKNWITPPAGFTLASKETRTVTVPINVPANAEPGGHYAVVRFTGTAKGEGQNQVSLSASIGSLVLLKVSGDVKQQAVVEEFYAAGKKYDKTSFFETGPIRLIARIKNEGNLHVKPTGTVVVTDSFGKDIATLRMNGDPAKEDDTPRSILPQSIRRFDTLLNEQNLFGRYKAVMNLSYGDGKTLTSTSYFWVIPYKMIIAIIALLVAIFFALRFGLRRYNAFIVRKASASPKENNDTSSKK